MDEILNPPLWQFTLGGWHAVINAETVVMTLVASVVVLALCAAVMHFATVVPGPFQSVVEIVVGAFIDMTDGSLGDAAPRYFPLIMATFLFVLISNWMGMIPFLSEPTRDLNTTLALALVGIAVAHASAIKVKGVKGYFRSYFEPFIFMFPLNVIGEFAKVLSLSFRLFGNIMGGAVIILVVSQLVRQLVLPPLLQMFFGVFVGAIQAFVFAMLTMTYISLAREG